MSITRSVNGAFADGNGNVVVPDATNTSKGLVQTTQVVSSSTSTVPLSGAVNTAIGVHAVAKATTSNVGHVRVDGDTIAVSAEGVISTSERMRIWNDVTEKTVRPIKMYTRNVSNTTGIIEINYSHVGFDEIFNIQITPVPNSVQNLTAHSSHIEEWGLTKAKIRTLTTIAGATVTANTNFMLFVMGR